MGLNGRDDVVGAAVMQEERTLPYAPKRSAAEVLGSGITLRNAIKQAIAHQMGCKVAVRRISNAALAGNMGPGCGLLVLHMAESAANGDEHAASIVDGCSGRRWNRSGS